MHEEILVACFFDARRIRFQQHLSAAAIDVIGSVALTLIRSAAAAATVVTVSAAARTSGTKIIKREWQLARLGKFIVIGILRSCAAAADVAFSAFFLLLLNFKTGIQIRF